jgi:HD superfamily phosphohydrolase
MRVVDPLYGAFQLSSLAAKLCFAPEVRRLSQIRLLNTVTPTLATLGELRRFSHTLGILNLFAAWKRSKGYRFSTAELDALEVAIILHDVATPPFGHLFEYILKEDTGWDHESAASGTFNRNHVVETTGHQIFAGTTPRARELSKRSKADSQIVSQILQKKHPLHALILGSLDFDNIDNVWRMAWALGLDADSKVAVHLASSIDVAPDGSLIVPRDAFADLEIWRTLRKKVYEELIFDSATVASQAILTRAFRIALRSGVINADNWTMTDEQMLDVLINFKGTKDLINLQYLGELPGQVITLQLPWKDDDVTRLNREDIEARVEAIFSNNKATNPLVYVFKEKGSFSKQLSFIDETGAPVSIGTTSKSLVVYIFGNGTTCREAQRNIEAIQAELLALFNVKPNEILRVSTGAIDEYPERSLKLDF